jgi:hypothetical protein
MLARVVAGKGEVLLPAASPTPSSWKGAPRSSMDELAAATLAADKAFVF